MWVRALESRDTLCVPSVRGGLQWQAGALPAGMCAYAWGNNIFNNPGITYSKGHRMDQEKRDDDPNSLARSKRYTSGIFRRLGDVRGPRSRCPSLDTCFMYCSTLQLKAAARLTVRVCMWGCRHTVESRASSGKRSAGRERRRAAGLNAQALGAFGRHAE